jgi:hypothetical protein
MVHSAKTLVRRARIVRVSVGNNILGKITPDTTVGFLCIGLLTLCLNYSMSTKTSALYRKMMELADFEFNFAFTLQKGLIPRFRASR